ncbi:DUF6943 family protein [Chitinophaga sp. 22321]|uniref:DUF6943 family protein n=1 Tax=Chitinophaga sp. 22321 TaxID=3453909 RepID=UPI003F82483A
MEKFSLKCFSASGTGKPAAFFLLSRGRNTGRPAFQPYRNSYAFFCSAADTQTYYQCILSLFKAGCFRQFLHGSVIEFICVGDLQAIISNAIAALHDIEKIAARMQTIDQLEISLHQKLHLLDILRKSLLQS